MRRVRRFSSAHLWPPRSWPCPRPGALRQQGLPWRPVRPASRRALPGASAPRCSDRGRARPGRALGQARLAGGRGTSASRSAAHHRRHGPARRHAAAAFVALNPDVRHPRASGSRVGRRPPQHRDARSVDRRCRPTVRRDRRPSRPAEAWSQSLSRPGGNITGVSRAAGAADRGKNVELIKET